LEVLQNPERAESDQIHQVLSLRKVLAVRGDTLHFEGLLVLGLLVLEIIIRVVTLTLNYRFNIV
jgi:hypothetical protein